MNEVEKRQQELIAEFGSLKSWEDRYKKIISLGKDLGDLPANLKTDEAKVKGCQSQVWLHASLSEDKRLQLKADSDALLVKGLVALLLRVYSNAPLKDVLESPPHFIKELGFESNLSPSRANGLLAMIKQIRYFALAYQHLG